MSYRIEYAQEDNISRLLKNGERFSLWYLLILPIGAICLRVFFPQAAGFVWDLLMPGFNEFSMEALSAMLADLRGGAPFGETIAAFCQTIAGRAAA